MTEAQEVEEKRGSGDEGRGKGARSYSKGEGKEGEEMKGERREKVTGKRP